MDIFVHNFFVGIGFGSFKFGGDIFHTLIYPHNVFSEVLAELGILGFVLFMIIIVYPFISFWKIKRNYDSDLVLLIIGIFIASFINANLSGHIGANYYLWFSLGVMYSMKKINSENKVTKK